MLTESRRKQYVEVLATHYVDGEVRPRSIHIPLVGEFDIEEVKRVGLTKDHTTHEIAKQYTVVVKGKETHLFEDSGRWFVLMKS
ncbi:hypothetical protein [Acutalibacter sp. JLR.KK004]|jgi:hypothetical protein|uniref:hypothetical protein n=1 Tax=Acutalibacter sp. JLR.KK004 TaxID=3112622 RepID=UPI002FF402FC